VVAAVGSSIGAASAGAQAQPSPNPCSASQLHLDIDQAPTLVRLGDVINYTLAVDNIGLNACDVKNVNVTLQVPSRSGAPSGTLLAPPAATGLSLAAQAIRKTFGPFPYTVDVDPGVTVLRARTAVDKAELQDIARSPVNINKEISAILFTPSITIDKIGSTTGPLPAPQDVTYTFFVRNGSPVGLDPAATAISNVTVTDDKCGSPKYLTGDTNNDQKLQVTETWAFQCTLTHPAAGTYTNVATASGQNILNNRPVPVVSPPDNWTVVLTAPPAPQPAPAPVPHGGVKGANAAQPACTLATSKSLKVRAGELTTIKVTAKNVPAKTLVKIKLPGGKVVSARTNSKGVALLHVRPPKSGTATLTAADCSDVEKLTVRAARRVVSQRVPQVTG